MGRSTFGTGGTLAELGTYVFGVILLKLVVKQLSVYISRFTELSIELCSSLPLLLPVSEHCEHDDREQSDAEKKLRVRDLHSYTVLYTTSIITILAQSLQTNLKVNQQKIMSKILVFSKNKMESRLQHQ